MYGMVQLDDKVEISIERVGKRRAAAAWHSKSPAASTVSWSRAALRWSARRRSALRLPRPGHPETGHGAWTSVPSPSPPPAACGSAPTSCTRSKLGFSILAVVRDNPKELTANGVTYRHPDGLLNLTQFTQVALATVAYRPDRASARGRRPDIWPALLRGPLARRVQRAVRVRRHHPAGNRAGTGVPPRLHHAPPDRSATPRAARTTAWARCVRTSSASTTRTSRSTSSPSPRRPASSWRS